MLSPETCWPIHFSITTVSSSRTRKRLMGRDSVRSFKKLESGLNLCRIPRANNWESPDYRRLRCGQHRAVSRAEVSVNERSLCVCDENWRLPGGIAVLRFCGSLGLGEPDSLRSGRGTRRFEQTEPCSYPKPEVLAHFDH